MTNYVKPDFKYVISELRCAVQALSSKASDQIIACEPGCVICELIDDFELGMRLIEENYLSCLSETQKEHLRQLAETLNHPININHECGEYELLSGPVWEKTRAEAKIVLDDFGWPFEPPPSFKEIEKGVWKRKM